MPREGMRGEFDGRALDSGARHRAATRGRQSARREGGESSLERDLARAVAAIGPVPKPLRQYAPGHEPARPVPLGMPREPERGTEEEPAPCWAGIMEEALLP
jgi:hypothetical protein